MTDCSMKTSTQCLAAVGKKGKLHVRDYSEKDGKLDGWSRNASV